MDTEGVPLCRFADGVQVNPSWIDNNLLPEEQLDTSTHFSEQSLPICESDDVIDAVINARDEEVSVAVLFPPTFGNAVHFGIVAGSILGCLGGTMQGMIDDAFSYTGFAVTSGSISGLLTTIVLLEDAKKLNKVLSHLKKIALFGSSGISGLLVTIPADYVCYNIALTAIGFLNWDTVKKFEAIMNGDF